MRIAAFQFLLLPGDCGVGHDAEEQEDTEEVGQTVPVNIKY